MDFEIKSFNDLTVDEMYEIAKSRFEVFVCEQEITESKILMIKIRNVIM